MKLPALLLGLSLLAAPLAASQAQQVSVRIDAPHWGLRVGPVGPRYAPPAVVYFPAPPPVVYFPAPAVVYLPAPQLYPHPVHVRPARLPLPVYRPHDRARYMLPPSPARNIKHRYNNVNY